MKEDIKTITIDSPFYPPLLKEISDPPQKLYIKGNLSINEPTIAIVGTRKATQEGIKTAEIFAEKLGLYGVTIISGLAMGIDAAAHRGALNSGTKTIAVLGCGIDKIYPAQNESIAQKILESGGGIISEYPPGSPSYKHQFLERNRIVSGLSLGTIIIEAPERSGSIRTANSAAEQGRSIFVIPGPINHPNFKGSHNLIREGATLATSIEEIMQDLNIEIKQEKEMETTSNLNETQYAIYNCIKKSGRSISIDKISEGTKLHPKIINQNITDIVITGLIKESGGLYNI
ncbi:MAG TPA: DNA-processing protein DprA [Candidatus Paceibacterota bacterium]